MRKTRFLGVGAALISFVALAGCSAARDGVAQDNSELGARAPDATGRGPFSTANAEYRLPATTDADILGDRKTEIWAQVYRPSDLTTAEKHPLLVFLHGNHGTCGRGENPRIDDSTQYTSTGTCPSGYTVSPSHLGYGYLAERLASWGYVVVSINANRGITAGGSAPGDGGLNLARGRLILKHLQLLSQWNATAGTTPSSLGFDLAGQLDFANVGLMGHSRGGEGVRAAYTQYHDPGSAWPERIGQVDFKAIFEIGPVDGQTSRVLNALGTTWNVLLPMCDGDVSNLQGMKPFDRMLAAPEASSRPKGMFAVWGANHNFFNTEWQQSDSGGCRGTGHTPLFQTSGVSGSVKQQTAGLHAMMGFFRAHVGNKTEASFAQIYDPMFQIPETLEAVTPIQRAYADAAQTGDVKVLEDFTKPAGTSLSGEPTIARDVTVTHAGVSEHDAVLKAANVKWTAAGGSFEIPIAAAGASVDASGMKTLDFRVARQATSGAAPASSALNFSIQLVNADGSASAPVKLSDHVALPVFGGHVVLETARIPLGVFTNASLGSVRAVRYVFDDTASGAIYLANLRFSRSPDIAATKPPVAGNNGGEDTGAGEIPTVKFNQGNKVAAIKQKPASTDVEIELSSPAAFPVLNDLARLRIGGRDVIASRYNDDGDTHNIVFTLSPEDVAAIPDVADMKVRYGDERATYEWDFGSFAKSQIKK